MILVLAALVKLAMITVMLPVKIVVALAPNRHAMAVSAPVHHITATTAPAIARVVVAERVVVVVHAGRKRG